MKVVRIITHLNIGGPSIQAARLTTELAARGHETTLVHGRLGEGEGDMRDLLPAGASNVIYVDALQRPIAPASDLRAFAAIFSAMRTIRPDVVHTHMAKAGLLGRLAAVVYNRTSGRSRPARIVTRITATCSRDIPAARRRVVRPARTGARAGERRAHRDLAADSRRAGRSVSDCARRSVPRDPARVRPGAARGADRCGLRLRPARPRHRPGRARRHNGRPADANQAPRPAGGRSMTSGHLEPVDSSLRTGLSSLDVAQDDPELVEGSKGERFLLVVRQAHHEREMYRCLVRPHDTRELADPPFEYHFECARDNLKSAI